MHELTETTFKERIFDFDSGDTFQFAGNRPAVLDFYADWCGPCKAIKPVLEELEKEYDGQVDFYQIDTEKEQRLSAAYGVKSIPMLIFYPLDGTPKALNGAVPKNVLKDLIEEHLINGQSSEEDQ